METRVVNGVQLDPIFAWRYGVYLISTDSVSAAESGIGYFTVALCDFSDYPAMGLAYVDRALSLADAVAVADFHARKEMSR